MKAQEKTKQEGEGARKNQTGAWAQENKEKEKEKEQLSNSEEKKTSKQGKRWRTKPFAVQHANYIHSRCGNYNVIAERLETNKNKKNSCKYMRDSENRIGKSKYIYHSKNIIPLATKGSSFYFVFCIFAVTNVFANC